MGKRSFRLFATSLACLLISIQPVAAKTVVFFDPTFPSIECGGISRVALEKAFAHLDPVFTNLNRLRTSLSDSDLLVLPYGSAFPADAWDVISDHIKSGNLLVIGGRPLWVPVFRDSSGWKPQAPQNSYSRKLGIFYSYEAPQRGPWSLKWDIDAPYFSVRSIDAERVFVNAGFGGRYRALAYLENANGDRLASPVVAEDVMSPGPPRRAVFLSFEGSPEYWGSDEGVSLIRQAAAYASFGGVRIYIDLQSLSIDPGDRITGTVDVVRRRMPATLSVEIVSGSRAIEKRVMKCDSSLHTSLALLNRPRKPGLYLVRAMLSSGDTVFEQYTSGVEVREEGLLDSGKKLGAGRDYFRLGGKPYLPVGLNYFSTDPYGRAFFVGQSIGGNPYVWERDFGMMEKAGFTIVRTGIWANRFRYLEHVSGASDERLLNAIEAFLDAAARHHMQVIFTLFAFNPGDESRRGGEAIGGRNGGGPNPFVDRHEIEQQLSYVRSIVSRFKDVPFLSYDLINEPTYANIEHIWKGNSPTGSYEETLLWQRWLANRYRSVDSLASSWHVPSNELAAFERVPLPSFEDIQQSRDNNAMNIRAVDYNHFAQSAFNDWVQTMIGAIRSCGSSQAVTVGQDEGGVTNRVLDQFIAETDVTYTCNHTWWQDDALLWDSVVPRTTHKPNLVEETGPQPVWTTDGSWRLADMNGLGLEERKMVLSFANGGAGVLHWDLTHSDDFGIMRRDGSQKVWMDVLRGVANFARNAEPYATETKLPDIALVIPQSLQLSTFNRYAIEAQQKAVRALYNFARGCAFVVGEYQLKNMPAAKLIIVPSPWIFSQSAWDELMIRVKEGATLLISGRVDADEHFQAVQARVSGWDVGYREEALRTRYAVVNWPEDSARLSFSGDKTTYLDRGALRGDRTYADIILGKGHILYFALPLELSDEVDQIGRVYSFAIKVAGASEVYSTSCTDPGVLIAPTSLDGGTIYVLTSETSDSAAIGFKDNLSGAEVRVKLAPGRGALLLVNREGKITASYNVR